MSKSVLNSQSKCFQLLVSVAVVCAISGIIVAQEATSTASAARARYLAEAGVLPASREIAVDEFVNYHHHEIGRPKAGEAVALDLRWGNDQVSPFDREAILQIGLSTALANDRQQWRPINLSLVIDKSGSMAAADKLKRVKSALLTFVNQLRETDFISIVVFDSEAQVLMPARALGDRYAVKETISSIEPGSSTNLHAGLMLGYHEALKNYRKDITNRVILLTDGIANQGVTDPEQISRDSLRFNDSGIDLSTIGVGLDLNKDLLRDLAKSGRGLFHFVADSQDIAKVFQNEVQSLVSPVANEPNLDISFNSDLRLEQVYGYDPHFRSDGVSLKLDNMNLGLTQVVLLRFRVAAHATSDLRPTVKVRLTYQDLERRQPITSSNESSLIVKPNATSNYLKDFEVRKNYSIARLAQAIRDMAAAAETRRYASAESILQEAIAETRQRYPNLQDGDIRRTLTIAQNYQAIVRRYKQMDP
jgi:Ca-activated chloride channel family protein